MAAQSMPKGLLAHIWRDTSGDVIFMEVGGDILNALQRLLQKPLGATLQACSAGVTEAPKHPLLLLASSVPKVCTNFSQDALEQPMPDALDWTTTLHGGIPGDHTHAEEYGLESQEKLHSQDCLRCLKEYGKRRPVLPGSYCEYCNTVWTPGNLCGAGTESPCYCPSCGVEATVDGSAGSCSNCGSQRVCTFGQVLSWPHCARCVADGRITSQMCGNGRCNKCGERGLPVCLQCGYCDACSVEGLGYSPPGAPNAPSITNSTGRLCHDPRGPFLLTNALEILKASPATIAGLSLSANCPVEFSCREPVSITPDMLREMVLRGLLGSPEVLTHTFPPRGRSSRRTHHLRHHSRTGGGNANHDGPSRSMQGGNSDGDPKVDTGSVSESDSGGSFIQSFNIVTPTTADSG